MVRQLRVEHPGVDIRLFEEEDNDAGAQGVLAGELDLAFTIGHRGGDLDSMLLLDDPFVLVAPRGELPDGPYPTAELDDLPLVGYPPSSCQVDIENGLRAVGASPTFVFRTYDNGAQMAMVRAGHGLGGDAAARRRHPRRRARRPVPVAGAAAAPDLPRVAARPHAVARRGTDGRAGGRGRQAPPPAARSPPDVRIVLIGPGAVGGVVGGRLFQHGHDVVLVARGAHREAIADARPHRRVAGGLGHAADPRRRRRRPS